MGVQHTQHQKINSNQQLHPITNNSFHLKILYLVFYSLFKSTVGSLIFFSILKYLISNKSISNYNIFSGKCMNINQPDIKEKLFLYQDITSLQPTIVCKSNPTRPDNDGKPTHRTNHLSIIIF